MSLFGLKPIKALNWFYDDLLTLISYRGKKPRLYTLYGFSDEKAISIFYLTTIQIRSLKSFSYSFNGIGIKFEENMLNDIDDVKLYYKGYYEFNKEKLTKLKSLEHLNKFINDSKTPLEERTKTRFRAFAIEKNGRFFS